MHKAYARKMNRRLCDYEERDNDNVATGEGRQVVFKALGGKMERQKGELPVEHGVQVKSPQQRAAVASQGSHPVCNLYYKMRSFQLNKCM